MNREAELWVTVRQAYAKQILAEAGMRTRGSALRLRKLVARSVSGPMADDAAPGMYPMSRQADPVWLCLKAPG